jgi:hypothetical protein
MVVSGSQSLQLIEHLGNMCAGKRDAQETPEARETHVVRLMTQRQQIVRWYRIGVATLTGLDEPGGITRPSWLSRTSCLSTSSR